MTKRLDDKGVWPIANNPRHPAWTANGNGTATGFADFRLKEIVRASAAAPFPMQAESIKVGPSDQGVFINGGVSPHNNPSLQALLTAARGGHGLGWPVGAERLFMVSVGSGFSPSMHQLRGMSLKPGVRSLHTMLNDSAEQIETMMQWMSESDTSRVIDATLGNLNGELLAGEPLLSYARYDARLDHQWLQDELDLAWAAARVENMAPPRRPRRRARRPAHGRPHFGRPTDQGRPLPDRLRPSGMTLGPDHPSSLRSLRGLRCYQPPVPGSPLKGPVSSLVIQPA